VRALRRGLLALLLGALLSLRWWAPAPAFAHASLIASFPTAGAVLAAPPGTIRLWFSQPVQVLPGGITILDPTGHAVARGPIHDDGIDVTIDVRAAAQGSYLVRWGVISLDTHPASGSFVFAVGRVGGIWASTANASGTPPIGTALQTLARLLHFIGYALSVGTIAFTLLVVSPPVGRRGSIVARGGIRGARNAWLPFHDGRSQGSGTPTAQGLATPGVERRLWRYLGAGVALLLLAEPLALLAQLASLGTGNILDGSVATALMASSFGRPLAQRLAAAMLLWALAGMARAGTTWATRAMLVLGLALAVADAQAGHAVGAPTAVAVTAAHLAAMSVWVGGLAALLGVWGLIEPDRRGVALSRFGQLAAGALAALALSGVVLAWERLAQPGDLLATGYGRTLLVKIAMTGGAMALAWFGLRAGQARRLRWWRWELGALLAVLVLAGLLVSLAPPR
jgi:copper transport protein